VVAPEGLLDASVELHAVTAAVMSAMPSP
jgi:hypothetical protein